MKRHLNGLSIVAGSIAAFAAFLYLLAKSATVF
jgi:hypothetical protein